MDHHQQILISASMRPVRGMTLLETMVSLALVAGVIILIFVSLGNQSRVATEQFVEVDLQTQLRRGNDEIFNVLADAHLIALSDDARWVEFNYPRQPIDGTGRPVPGALSLRMDGTVEYGIFDDSTSPPTWVPNGFHHLETVDDTAEQVVVNSADWFIDQSNGGNVQPLTFVPVRFEMTSYRRATADLRTFNNGTTNAANEANRLSNGYPRLVCSAIIDYTAPSGNKYAEPNPTGLAATEVNGPFKMYTRTLTLRCYRDATPRLAAPYNKGEGVFYMRRQTALSPLQRANTFTDSNLNGEYDDGEPVTPEIYPPPAPIVYRGQYCPADSDPFNEEVPPSLTRNNVVDTEAITPGGTGRYYHSIRIILYAVHSGAVGGLSRGIQGVKRVLSSQTSIRLRNGNFYR